MKIWFKIYKDSHMVKDTTISDETNDTRTHKIFHAIDAACRELDLAVPIWLKSNVSEFKKRSKTRFTKDAFVEEIDFDYLEVHVIEDD